MTAAIIERCPPHLPNQLTEWLDRAIQGAAHRRPDFYETKRGIALALQSCCPGVVALEVKTHGKHSRGTLARHGFVVLAGDEQFLVIEKSPWLERDSIERLHAEQLEKLTALASIQPQLDMKTLVVSQESKPAPLAKEEQSRQWAQAVMLRLQASMQAEFLRSNSDDVQAPAAGSRSRRL